MKEDTLMELGLSLNESRIYLSLLENGSSSITQIADQSKIHRVNVYDSIKKLKNKGLVGEMNYEGKKSFQASPPQVLRNILKEKEIKLEQVLPQLELFSKVSPPGMIVQVYEGYDFLRNLFLHFLELKEPIYACHVPKFVVDYLGTYFQEIIHKRRAQQRQMMYHIYSKNALERIKLLNTLPYTKARYLDDTNEHNVTLGICGDEIALQIFSSSTTERPVIITIKNKQIAEAYKHDFQLLWDMALEP